MSQNKDEAKGETVPRLDCYELLEYGVDPDIATGGFRTPDVPQYLAREFPELHIVSFIGNRKYANRYLPDCPWYYVSNGNPDPTIEWTVGEIIMEDILFITEQMRGDGSSERRERMADATELLLLNICGVK